MRALQGGLVVAVVLGLAGCSTPAPRAPVTSATTPAAAATRQVDLQRLDLIKDSFPTDYPANAFSGVRKVDARQAASVGDLISYGNSVTVEPDSCRALLKPVRANVGGDWIAVNNSQGPEGPFISVAAYDPAMLPAAIPESGCDRFGFVVEGATPDGQAEQPAVPRIDDATTYALKVEYPVTNPAATKPLLVEYFYVAILDGRTFVKVWARVPTEYVAEPALPDLLTKAVIALRGK